MRFQIARASLAAALSLLTASAPVALAQTFPTKSIRLIVPGAPGTELPTMSEAGVPGFDVSSWFGIVAPARTPPDIVSKFNREIVDILSMPDVRQRFASEALHPVSDTPQQLGAFVTSEIRRWAKVIKSSGARAE